MVIGGQAVRVSSTKSIQSHSVKDWRVVDHSKAIERRTTTPKKPKSVPVNAQQMEKKVAAVIKPETRQTANTKRISGTGATITRIGGVNFTWDSKTLHYKRVA